jgi:hypothetical protein
MVDRHLGFVGEKDLALSLSLSQTSAGCGWFGSPEVYKSESARTTYRAVNGSPTEHPEVPPAPQKSRANRDSGPDRILESRKKFEQSS